jgi:uncharacterized integral membrane protein (TIGR00697 family)
MNDFIILLWILVCLGGASAIAVLTKKFGSWIGISVLAGLAVISNVLASAKIIVFPFGLSAPSGIVAYALSFFLMDMLNEFYGRKEAMKGVYAGIISQLLTVPLIWLTLQWPAAPFMPADKVLAANVALGLSPWIFIVGVFAFSVASILNIIIFDFLRKATHGALLWFRSKASTITAIFAANLIFIPLGYYGTGSPILTMIKGHSIVQIMIAILDTIFMYLVIFIIKNGKNKTNI